MKDILLDIYMLTNLDKLLSNLQGGFINLIKLCCLNKDI